MNAVAALHNAARHYCIERVTHWQPYAELRAAGKGEVREPGGNWNYTEEAYGIFPRYNVLRAILSDIERSTPMDFDSIDAARTWLAEAGATAPDPFAVKPIHPAAEQATAEERRAFVRFVEHSDESDWSRKLTAALSARPADRRSRRRATRASANGGGAGTLYSDWVDALPGREQAIRSMLSTRGITGLFEIREFGDQYELDQQAASFSYNGAEGYWFTDELGWMIYASHEGSITFGGDWLIQAVRDSTPNIEKYV